MNHDFHRVSAHQFRDQWLASLIVEIRVPDIVGPPMYSPLIVGSMDATPDRNIHFIRLARGFD